MYSSSYLLIAISALVTFYFSMNQDMYSIIDYKLQELILRDYSMSDLCKSMQILSKIFNLLIYPSHKSILLCKFYIFYAYFNINNK